MSDNLITDLIKCNNESLVRLTDIIDKGVGNKVQYAEPKSKFYVVKQSDVDRAETTIANLSQPYTAEYLGDLQIRLFSQLSA
tara:strand:- start:813 stop:1058 length:246 start_codon:yes stop_codon:yes gene_type:complete